MKSETIEPLLLKLLECVPSRSIETVKGASIMDLRENMARNIPRIAFQLEILAANIPKNGTIADIGGGINLFGLGAIEMGYTYHLVDDFSDRWHSEAEEFIEIEKERGVKIISQDILSEPFPFPPHTIDAVTSFDCLEHLPISPKPLLHDMTVALRPGGVMFLGVPNCVNLRKRMTVPFGIGKWSPMQEWYEEPRFRGHVREPDVEDLHYIAQDLGLTQTQILGRNWLGYSSRYRLAKLATPYVDRILQLRPSLCSNIYLLGRI